jgi:hypothetical protein
MAAIRKLGDFETKLEDYQTTSWDGTVRTYKLLLFRGDGFDGMVMPKISVDA